MFEPKTEAERTVLAFFQALGGDDFDRARALMTPDMRWAVMGTGVPGAGTHVGPDAIFAVIGPIRALFAPGSPRMTLRCVTSNEDRVVMETHGGGEFADGRPYVSALIEHMPGQLLWGTDWPHPRVHGDMPDDGESINTLLELCPDADTLEGILVRNPQALYGFDDPV